MPETHQNIGIDFSHSPERWEIQHDLVSPTDKNLTSPEQSLDNYVFIIRKLTFILEPKALPL